MKEAMSRLWASSTFRVLLLGCVVVLAFALVLVATRAPTPTADHFKSTVTTSTKVVVAVPSLIGLPQDAAQSLLQADNLKSTVAYVPGAGTRGVVLSQSPVAGSSVAPQSAVLLNEAEGSALPVIPNVNGQAEAAAKAALSAAGFVVHATQTAFSDVTAGDVIATEPPGGTSVPANSVVVVVVSRGPEPVKRVPTPKPTPTTRPPKQTTTTTTPPTTTTSTRPPRGTTTTTTPPTTTSLT
jgi:beta-lactam-binding protein with PASTA domain